MNGENFRTTALLKNTVFNTPPSIFEVETQNFTWSFLNTFSKTSRKPIFDFWPKSPNIAKKRLFWGKKFILMATRGVILRNSKIGFRGLLAIGLKKLSVKFQVSSSKIEGGVYNWSWKTKIARKTPSKFSKWHLNTVHVLTKMSISQKLKRIFKFCKMHVKGEEIYYKIRSSFVKKIFFSVDPPPMALNNVST